MMRIQILSIVLLYGLFFHSCSEIGFASDSSDPVQAAVALAQRVLGADSERFVFNCIPANATEGELQDVFELANGSSGQIVIRGNNAVAMASGLHQYLREYCGCHISWRTQRVDLPVSLPKITGTIRITTPYRYRYYFNYCCFSYSLAWWGWNDWERMIDLMALYGVNAPLSVTGQEGVWRNVAKRVGLNQSDLQDFFVGPAFLPFGWMGCIDGWAGPLPEDWIDEHVAMQQRILARQRELGMTPILQGFTGHAPAKLQTVKPDLKMVELTPWCNFPPTWFIDPKDPYFVEFGKIFIEEQTKLFGTDHLYASDTFIEMPPTNDDPVFLQEMGKSIYDSMASADPEAIWVLQGWIFVNAPRFWQKQQRDAFLLAVPQDSLLMIDLFCEKTPVWEITEAFSGQPWIWSIIQNFGGQVTLHGDLDFMANNLKKAIAQKGNQSGTLSGIGYIMEGIGYNSVIDTFQAEMIWRNSVPETSQWLDGYVCNRYGVNNSSIRDAWRQLHQHAYKTSLRKEFPLSKRPSFSLGIYDLERDLIPVWEKLLEGSDQLGAVDSYRFDLVNVSREALSSLSTLYHLQIIDAFQKKDRDELQRASDRMNQLILDIDRLLATQNEYLLGPYLEQAKSWGRTPEQASHYEWNARTLITLWGPVDSPLDDYAIRQWSGLLSDYIAPRWRLYCRELDRLLEEAEELDFQRLDRMIREKQLTWTHQNNTFPTTPSEEDTVAVSKELLEKYKKEFFAESDIHKMLSEIGEYQTPNLAAYPPMSTLTTGKPIKASAEIPGYSVQFANDGIRNQPDNYWSCESPLGGTAWVQIDLEEPTEVNRVDVVCYYGDLRNYGFIVEGSLDGENWTKLADRRYNIHPSTIEGYECRFDTTKIRYLRVTQTSVSTVWGRHIVEIMAFGP